MVEPEPVVAPKKSIASRIVKIVGLVILAMVVAALVNAYSDYRKKLENKCPKWCENHPADWLFSAYSSDEQSEMEAKCRFKECNSCVFKGTNDQGDSTTFDCSALQLQSVNSTDRCPNSRKIESRGCEKDAFTLFTRKKQFMPLDTCFLYEKEEASVYPDSGIDISMWSKITKTNKGLSQGFYFDNQCKSLITGPGGPDCGTYPCGDYVIIEEGNPKPISGNSLYTY